jgi:hypothetical protein
MKKRNALLFNQGGKCFYCEANLELHEATIDHVIPQSKGGTNDLDNLVVCCQYANQAFRDYSPKQKMAVIKQLDPSSCQKIFPRDEPTEVENVSQIGETTEKKKPAKNPKKTSPDISMAYKLLLQAVDLFEKEGREVVSSQVKKKMLELNPSFKESDYGFNQFNQFLLHAKEEKIITLNKYKTTNNYIIKKCQ